VVFLFPPAASKPTATPEGEAEPAPFELPAPRSSSDGFVTVRLRTLPIRHSIWPNTVEHSCKRDISCAGSINERLLLIPDPITLTGLQNHHPHRLRIASLMSSAAERSQTGSLRARTTSRSPFQRKGRDRRRFTSPGSPRSRGAPALRDIRTAEGGSSRCARFPPAPCPGASDELRGLGAEGRSVEKPDLVGPYRTDNEPASVHFHSCV
jgi:hypothetical protein